ncbi:hypothetical protein [Aliiruegeria lutimaris]|uniref:Uncharacterized protein n=1 Tax=Aliiruegeria lutimaris TaxID=571298 RepID=A0A1G8PJM7_9RHOB|nr:hypothetical protein [Aliiruegeria lutimaris]SDI92647.1 hypothetical protein SAMN04488026_100923 [Aliiruegeria lutimaris]
MHPVHGYQMLNGERRYKSKIMFRSFVDYFPPLRFLSRFWK